MPLTFNNSIYNQLKLCFWIIGFISIHKNVHSQQLIINEVSQGPSGAKEYVELLVTGTSTCNGTPCMDLRNYIIDDNNGNHASGAGTGIAAGCVRLRNISFWQCIPYGTLILIYNDADLNTTIPPIDLSMLDGNCRLIIPISNCTLLERFDTQPSTANAFYPVNSMFTNCGSWGPVSMANGDDSFQTISPTGTLLHAVSWGNNTLNTIIYFPGSSGGSVAMMTNAMDNNPANQANWSLVSVAGNETPGSPNNLANSIWINSMNNACQPFLPFTASVTSIPAGCSCNGSATLTVAGAIAPYTYTWLPNGGNSNTATGLCSGTYTILSSSFNGCLQSTTASIASAGSLSANIVKSNVSCIGLANGSATVIQNSGNPPFTYTWIPSGGNSAVANGLSAGTYTVLYTDANNCNGTGTVNITQPTAITNSVVINNTNCGATAATGGATITLSGGTPGYTFNWLPAGGTNSVATGLLAGSYTANITDANGCNSNAVATILQTGSLNLSISKTNVSCNGGTNGSAAVSVSGGSTPYSYNWLPNSTNGNTINNLSSGVYTVIVSDANNCNGTGTVNITQPTAITNSVVINNTNCGATAATGGATITLSGGTPGYTFNWLPAGGTNSVATGLLAGSYTANITDANGCNSNAVATILQTGSLNLSISKTNVSCNGGTNGSATVTVSGGSSPYSYNWLPNSANSNTINNLSAGNYTVTVSDANNCSGSGTVSITQPLPIIANVNALKLCYGQNGLLISNISGGSLPHSYFWNNISGTNNLSINPIATSIYSLYVIDANGCQSNIDTAQVTIGNQLTLNASPSKTICAGNSVLLFAQANGGTGNYQYSWQPGAMAGQSITTTPTATMIYTVNVTDGCSQPQASQLITITIENLSQSIINADKFSGCAPLCVSFTNSSFINNLSIQSSVWNFSDGSSLISISPTYCFNKTGNYTAYNTFTTSSGCKDSVKLNKIITIYPKPLANFVASTNSVTTDAPTIQFSNLSTNATNYYWDFAGMSNSNNFNTYYNFSNTGKHLVTLVAFNEFCSDTAFKLIESFPEFTFYAPNTFTPNKDNINDIFLPIGEGWDTASFSMEIFNRWGELIFYSKKYNEGWNADYKNTRVKNDIYVWKVSLKDIFGKQHRYIGKITVLN